MSETVTPYAVDDTILTIRGQKVILDSDLARIYGVEVKRLNEQVKRNQVLGFDFDRQRPIGGNGSSGRYGRTHPGLRPPLRRRGLL